MMFSNNFAGFAFNAQLHMLFVLVLLLGLAFLIIWAAKTLKKQQLKQWAIWLLVIGFLGLLLTNPWSGRGFFGMDPEFGNGFDDMREEMEEHMGFEAS